MSKQELKKCGKCKKTTVVRANTLKGAVMLSDCNCGHRHNIRDATTKEFQPTMKATEIADKLEYYNEWRRGADTKMPNPKKLGIAIEEAVKVLREVDNKNKHKRSLKKISNKEDG